MSSDLRVTLVQADLVWHDAAANRDRLARLLEPLVGTTDLVVLPEMFTSGFSMQPELIAEPTQGPTIAWMRELANHLQATLTGSIATRDGERFVNRMIWMTPDGTQRHYDKRHLFRMAKEHEHYAAGQERLVVMLHGWRVRPMVCYDLRFPVWSRNAIGTEQEYDLLVYVANWPARRRHAWRTLLRARAIENLSYCVGVNRVGVDGKNIDYCGDSVAVDYLGVPLSSESELPLVQTVTLSKAALVEHRTRFPAHLDADEFELQ